MFIQFKTVSLLGLLAVCLILVGCTTETLIPDQKHVRLNPNLAWARVLQTFVDENGRIDFKTLSKNRYDLESYLLYVGKFSPVSHPKKYPNRWAKLAYYINAYNAMAMYNILQFDRPQELDAVITRLKFYSFTKFLMGGEYVSLYEIENEYLKDLRDPRAYIGINRMTEGSPKLSQTPYDQNNIDAQLDYQALLFFNQTKFVQIHEHQSVVRFSPLAQEMEPLISAQYPSLTAYANSYRRDALPTKHEVDFSDFNWSVIHPTVSKRQIATDREKGQ